MDEASHDLNLSQTSLGEILTDAAGNSLYLFSNDEQGSGASNCNGDCIAMWPAVSPISTTAEGLNADLVSSIERSDGSAQAAYNGWPLYTFVKDAGAGDTNGQGMKGVWWVIDAQGNAIGA